jgi:hypothetical protein
MLMGMHGRTYIGLCLTMIGACGFDVKGGSAPDDGGGSGSDGGGTTDGAPICPWPYTPEYVTPCPGKTGSELELLAGKAVLNTDDGTLMVDLDAIDIETEIAMDVRIVWVTGMHIGPDADLRVIGSLPVVFVANGAITIEGDLDGAGHTTSPLIGDNPAGANPSECGDMDTTGAKGGAPCADQGASGGGGGSFAGVGGQGGGGGEGRNCGAITGPIPGGTAGAIVATRPANLRGGCAGGFGGLSTQNGASSGRGGSGGGAIALVARNTLAISGRVNVGGAGGGGASKRSGGGGGGSGGMIVLEGSTVTVAAAGRVSANGGGGGGGCDGNTGDDGEDGKDGNDDADGGVKEGAGTDGGDGGARGSIAEPAEVSSRGGGGGGGGVGYVRIHSAINPAQADVNSISPTPSP